MMSRNAGLLLVAFVVSAASCASRADAPVQVQPKADRLLGEGRYEDALRVYSESAYGGGGRPSYRAYVGMATCYAYLGDAARFEVHALEASSIAPTEVAAHRRLGRMYIAGAERFRQQPSGQRYARIGVEYLRRVYFADDDLPNVAHNLGLGLYILGDVAAAAVMLEEAHRQSPRRDDTLHLLLTVLRDLDSRERVRELLTARAGDGELPASLRPYADWAAQHSERPVDEALGGASSSETP